MEPEKIKDFFKSIKQQFNDFMNPAPPPNPAAAAAPPPPAGTEYEVAGGGKCMIDKLEVGGIVLIDGAPALPGDLELADGTKLTVGDNGVISAVTPGAAAPPPPPAGDDMGAKFTALETTTNEKFTAYEAKFAAYEQRFQQYDTKLAQYSEMINKLLQFGELMVNKPATTPDPAVHKQQNNFNNTELGYDPGLFEDKSN